MRQERILIIDDLDPNSEADETIRFGLDGKEYEIDLTDRHATALRTTLARYANAGRRIRPGKTVRATTRPAGTQRAASAAEPRQIRLWAQAQGLPVSTKGRIPENVVKQYAAAH